MERPTGSSHISYSMALVVAAAGATGYSKSKSVPSLVGGLGIAAAFAAGGLLINSGRPDRGHPVSLLASLALVGIMAPRAVRTFKLPPSVLSLLGLGSAWYQANKTVEWWDT